MSGTSPNLGIQEIVATQDQKEVTTNNAITALDNAMNATAAVSLATGNAATLTSVQFAAAGNFECSGHTAAAVLTLPAGMKRKFTVNNLAAFAVTVGYQTGGAVAVAANSMVSLVGNGTFVAGAESADAGITTLDGLIDVNTGGAGAGDVLRFDGSVWVPGTIGAGAGAFADLTGTATFAQLPGEAANLPVGFSHPGTMSNAEVLLVIPVNQTLTIPSGLAGTYLMTDGTLPTASTAIIYAHFTSSAWVNRGTLTINTGGTLAITGGPTADITVVPGEGLRFVGQATADATFKDFGIVTMLKKV